MGKVDDVLAKIKKEELKYDILIFCDTICYCEGKIIEKPTDEKEAFEILSLFNGKSHSVYTNLHIILKNSEQEYFDNRTAYTEVVFDDIPNESILEYSKSDHYK